MLKAVRRFRWEASAPFAGRLVFDFIVFVPFTSLSVRPLMFICLTVFSVSPVVLLNMKMDRGRTGRWIYTAVSSLNQRAGMVGLEPTTLVMETSNPKPALSHCV